MVARGAQGSSKLPLKEATIQLDTFYHSLEGDLGVFFVFIPSKATWEPVYFLGGFFPTVTHRGDCAGPEPHNEWDGHGVSWGEAASL